MFKSTVLVAAGAIVLMGSLSACSKGNAMSADQSITAAVQKNINGDPALAGDAITASTQNGVVTLTGNVPTEAARVAAAKDAQVQGATQVDNQIATTAPINAAPAASTAMRESAPAASAPAPARHVSHLQAATPVQVESGTTVHIRLTQGLSSATANAGQTFQGTIAEPVLVNGQIAIPRGAAVEGSIAAADSAGHFKGQSRLVLTLDRLSYDGQSYHLSTHDVTRLAASRGKRSLETIGGGAGLGALIGALAGHGKGAAIGAAVGAGAGTAAQAMTKPAEVVLPAETVLPFTLTQPVQVVPAASAGGQ